jgi:hypothetical protein
MEKKLQEFSDISDFYRAIGSVYVHERSLGSLNEKGTVYAPLPDYGVTRFITGIVIPDHDTMESAAKTIQDAVNKVCDENFRGILAGKTENHWRYRKTLMQILNLMEPAKDIRWKAASIGADALIYFKPWKDGRVAIRVGEESYPLYKGVPVVKVG